MDDPYDAFLAAATVTKRHGAVYVGVEAFYWPADAPSPPR
jgi:hypothetical protein